MGGPAILNELASAGVSSDAPCLIQLSMSAISCEVGEKDVVLTAPILDPWLQESFQRRFSKAFGKRLRFLTP